MKRKRDTYSKINDDPGATSWTSSTASLSSPSVSFCSMKIAHKETAYSNSCREQHDSLQKRRKREKMTHKSWCKWSQLESKCVHVLCRAEGYRKDFVTYVLGSLFLVNAFLEMSFFSFLSNGSKVHDELPLNTHSLPSCTGCFLLREEKRVSPSWCTFIIHWWSFIFSFFRKEWVPNDGSRNKIPPDACACFWQMSKNFVILEPKTGVSLKREMTRGSQHLCENICVKLCCPNCENGTATDHRWE